MCVACMDGKLADRKGYEFFRKLTGTAEPLAASASSTSAPALSASADAKTTVRPQHLFVKLLTEFSMLS